METLHTLKTTLRKYTNNNTNNDNIKHSSTTCG